MELTVGSETSANHNLTPGKYPKEYIQYSKHGEILKSITQAYNLRLSESGELHDMTTTTTPLYVVSVFELRMLPMG
jgi:carbohydrate-binding DOMON domain-containing protein